MRTLWLRHEKEKQSESARLRGTQPRRLQKLVFETCPVSLISPPVGARHFFSFSFDTILTIFSGFLGEQSCEGNQNILFVVHFIKR